MAGTWYEKQQTSKNPISIRVIGRADDLMSLWWQVPTRSFSILDFLKIASIRTWRGGQSHPFFGGKRRQTDEIWEKLHRSITSIITAILRPGNGSFSVQKISFVFLFHRSRSIASETSYFHALSRWKGIWSILYQLLSLCIHLCSLFLPPLEFLGLLILWLINAATPYNNSIGSIHECFPSLSVSVF